MNNKVKEKIESCEFSFSKEIKSSQIVFEPTLRKSCELNHCGKYKSNYCCPPHVGEIDDCIKKAQNFGDGYIFQLITQLEDSYDFEGMMEGQERFKEKILKLNDLLHEANCKNFLLLGAGPCSVCETCGAITGKECPNPSKKIASVESHGIFINPTLINVGLKYNNGENTVSYCGVVLIGGNKNE
ncbi:MAG: DUF2284 domain-containing protein [Bacillota bacterium]